MPIQARILKFTDTLADINGVCRFIQNTATTALTTNHDLTVYTSTRLQVPDQPNIKNFPPIYARPMPGYDTLDLAIPPFLTMLRAAEDHNPTVIHISTPGPVGLVGMTLAKLTRTPIVGLYHTDFPAYIDELFDSKLMSKTARIAMRTFYKQFATVLTRSTDYATRLQTLGINPKKIQRLTPGFDNTQFSPSFRDPTIWKANSVPADGIKILFCGRISTEKNLPVLTQHWPTIQNKIEATGQTAHLIIIGDGPYRKQMESKLANRNAHFLGFKHKKELATLYASSDIFVFPSTTDTLGQVVMEAQASGLPVIATNQGGPKEVIQHNQPKDNTGLVLPIENPKQWASAITTLALDPDLRSAMGTAGIKHMKSFTFNSSFTHYWSIHQQAHTDFFQR